MWHGSKLNWSVKRILRKIPIIDSIRFQVKIYRKFSRNLYRGSLMRFFREYGRSFYFGRPLKNKVDQFARLIERVEIVPIENNSFLYILDCFKSISSRTVILDNLAVDYDMIVSQYFPRDCPAISAAESDESQATIKVLFAFVERCKKNPIVCNQFSKQLYAIESLFERPASSFFEALQRILFYNQFLWQTGHTLNGLGHLDWILEKLYEQDIANGVLTRQNAKGLLKDFFYVLHEHYWFKSAMLMGDTGQIIILGGRDSGGKYHCNDLTYLFIEVSKELRLPDPKVLLRCTADMPEDLLDMALDCIATGIGAPLLSNDDTIIPALLSCGYGEADAYHYGTSACWEPLVPGVSCEANNIASLNFAIPFTELFSAPCVSEIKLMDEILKLYEKYLAEFIRKLLTPLTELQFEDDPLLSLASPSAMERRKNITCGGAKYNNLGLTSVGLGTVVNSLLNIEKIVFEEGRYTLSQLNEYRKGNFAKQEELLQEMKGRNPCFGCDDKNVVELTKRILAFTSGEFSKYKTKYGGNFKFGLSSPSYITEAQNIPATFDGRRNGDPFSVHISSGVAVPATELLSFAMKLDYNGNRLNGNVIDFITSPSMLRQNRDKYAALLRTGFARGIFQLQMNVVDSKTLIAAKANPKLFPQLVVRVWGFSAYFNDLPEEYQDVLIARALESEKAV